MSDEDDPYYSNKAMGKQRAKGGRTNKSTKERKPYPVSNRQRRVKSSFEDDEFSAEDSESNSDDGFKSTRRRGAQLRKSNARSALSTNISGRNCETRTSSRSVRKVSYVESEESEEVDEGRKKRSQKVVYIMLYFYVYCMN